MYLITITFNAYLSLEGEYPSLTSINYYVSTFLLALVVSNKFITK